MSLLRPRAAYLLLALNTAVYAAPTDLIGTVGKFPIVMRLDGDDEFPDHYYYRKFRQNIVLQRDMAARNEVVLCETEREGRRCDGFHLKAQPDGRWSGYWEARGKRLDVQLEPLTLARVQAESGGPASHPDNLFEAMRHAGLQVNCTTGEVFQGHQLQWCQAPHSTVRVFRVVDGYARPVLERINRRLAALQDQLMRNGEGCLALVGQDYHIEMAPRLLTDRLFSASVYEYASCGGAHPELGDLPLTIDVATGRDLVLEDIVWFGKGKPSLPRDARGQRTGDDRRYEENVFGPAVARLMEARMAGQALEKDCDYGPEQWQYASWYLTPKGLYLNPVFGHSQLTCANPGWSVLPWSEVRKHPGAHPELLP